MRTISLFLTLAFLTIPLAAAGDPTHDTDPCAPSPRDPKGGNSNCTGVQAGNMECMPAAGKADTLSSVVGAADNGTFKLYANGTNHPGSASACTFEIRVDVAGASFDKGWAPSVLGTPGQVTGATSQPCTTLPGQTCTTTATFTWWRAQHGVTFDVPFVLYVNGVEVARGSCHYYDPPTGPTVVLTNAGATLA
ncbi:MAG: hypothetical protein WDA16_01465 [Candidatus Thermoplasmatota archaeon]